MRILRYLACPGFDFTISYHFITKSWGGRVIFNPCLCPDLQSRLQDSLKSKAFTGVIRENSSSTNVACLGLVSPIPHGVELHLLIGLSRGRDEQPGIEVECSPGYGGHLDLQHIRLYQYCSEVCHQLGDVL